MWINRLLFTLWAAFPVALVLLALRPLSRRQLQQFVDRYSAPLTPETTPLLGRAIVRNRRGRLFGAALGLTLHPVLSGVGVATPNWAPLLGFGGYLVGGFLAALVPGRRTTGQQRASLVPRRSRYYLSRLALAAPTGTVAISGVADLVYFLEPRRTQPGFSGNAYAVVVVVMFAVATVLADAVIVRRPQPVSTADLVAVDDAIRANALHTVAGAGIAVMLLGTTACLLQMGGWAASPWLHVTGLVAALLALIAAPLAWSIRVAPWQVRRAAAL